MRLQRFLEFPKDWGINLEERYSTGEIFTWCQHKGTPSRAARGYKSCRDERRSCRRGRLEVIGS